MNLSTPEPYGGVDGGEGGSLKWKAAGRVAGEAESAEAAVVGLAGMARVRNFGGHHCSNSGNIKG